MQVSRKKRVGKYRFNDHLANTIINSGMVLVLDPTILDGTRYKRVPTAHARLSLACSASKFVAPICRS